MVGRGAKIFQQCHMGGGGGGDDFSPRIRERGGGAFFLPIDFADPSHPLRRRP